MFSLASGLVKSFRVQIAKRRGVLSPPEGIAETAEWLRALAPEQLPYSYDVDKLAEWVNVLRQVRPNRPATRRIAIFTAMTHWNRHCLPIAVALAARVRVDLIFFPYREMIHCDPGRSSDEECPSGKCVSPVLLHPNLRVLNVRGVTPGVVTPEVEAMAQQHAEKDHRYATFREELPNPLTDEDLRIREFRYQRNLDAARRIENLLQHERYDSVLIPNGAIYEFGVAYERCKAAGLPVVTFDGHEQQFRMNLSDRVPCPFNDTEGLWKADEPHVLSSERRERIANRLMGREKPGWNTTGYSWDGQPSEAIAWQESAKKLGLDPSKPTAILCSNVAWDTAVLDRERAYRSMKQWLVETVRWFGSRSDWQLIIRAHPVEAKVPTNEPVVGVLKEHFSTLPANIALIGPNDLMNTYGLMRGCQLGLVYSSTIGLEMATRGMPVIVAANVHYGDKGFVHHPADAIAFQDTLLRVTADPESARPTPRQIEVAMCYADVYFERFPKPFPWWRLDSMEHFGTETPMADVLRGAGDPRFQQTLDMLAGLRSVA